MRNTVVVICLLSLSVACAADTQSGQSPVPRSIPGLRLVIEPVFPMTTDHAHVRVWLENVTGGGCLPQYIDPTFVARDWGGRPYVVLRFEIEDENGDVVASEPIGHAQYVPIKAHEFVTLDCSHSYGTTVELEPGRGEWSYSLAPGEYKITATAEVRVRSYLTRHPRVAEDLRALTGEGLRNEVLPETQLRSNEIEVVIDR